MTTPAPETTPQVDPATPAQQQPTQTPPWGSDEQFDPQRAWTLLQNTRADLDKAKAARLTDEQQQKLTEYDRLEQASKSELQRIQEAHDAEKKRADNASAEALRTRVALQHKIPADYLDLIGSGSEEQITANAERVAQLLAAQQAAQPTPPPTSNTPHLQPGATPSPAPGDDVAARHARIFGNRQNV